MLWRMPQCTSWWLIAGLGRLGDCRCHDDSTQRGRSGRPDFRSANVVPSDSFQLFRFGSVDGVGRLDVRLWRHGSLAVREVKWGQAQTVGRVSTRPRQEVGGCRFPVSESVSSDTLVHRYDHRCELLQSIAVDWLRSINSLIRMNLIARRLIN